MKKRITGDDAIYSILWSKFYPNDKYTIIHSLPDLAGIVAIAEKRGSLEPEYLMFYGCWRAGIRSGFREFLDPVKTRYKDLCKNILARDFIFKYTVIDSNSGDMLDILYALSKVYTPEFNNYREMSHSGRYKKVYVTENNLREGDIVEKFPLFGP